MVKFSVYFNGEPVKSYDLDEPVIFIGRLPENNIPISNMGVSRRHVKIELDPYNSYTMTDLNSLNGTLVNGKKVKKVTLCHGDKITIGKYTIVYEDFRAESAIEMETIVAEYRPEDMRKLAAAAAAGTPVHIAAASETPQVSAPPPDALPPEPILPAAAPVAIPVTPAAFEIPAALPQAPAPQPAKADAESGGAVLIKTSGHVVYKLERGFLSIGSDPADDIYATGFGVSKAFAAVEQRDGGFYISAQKALSKIKVNGKNVKTHRLEHRDRIEIGSNTFRFMENG